MTVAVVHMFYTPSSPGCPKPSASLSSTSRSRTSRGSPSKPTRFGHLLTSLLPLPCVFSRTMQITPTLSSLLRFRTRVVSHPNSDNLLVVVSNLLPFRSAGCAGTMHGLLLAPRVVKCLVTGCRRETAAPAAAATDCVRRPPSLRC